MILGNIVAGRQDKPIRALVYGVEGVGKSTFGAGAPAPIFLGAEDGTAHLDVQRFPMPATWQDVLDAVRILTTEAHKYQTLVIDTLDFAEPMVWDFICKRDNQPNVEAYGYGKGYAAALDEWRVFLAALDRLRAAKGLHLVLLAHSWIKPFRNPEGEDYDRHELKLRPNVGGLVKEWTDAVLFANFETFAPKEKGKKTKGVSTGARILHSTRTAAYDAKNRYSLPEVLPLSWDDFFEAARAHQPASADDLLAAIRGKIPDLEADVASKVEAGIVRAGGNAEKLAMLNDYVNGKINLEGSK
jgi:hypothetical protein